jgi:heme-degrading monooxygenase HmoA
MHLAELNIARLKHPIGDPRVAEFVDALDLVNGAGKRMPGFVWILEDEAGSATSFRIDDDPQMIVNLTVWESAEHLKRFVFGVVHKHFYEKRALWFDAMEQQHMVFWHVEPGALPTLQEAMARLEHLRAHGPSEAAFGWAEAIGPAQHAALRCG